MLQAKFHSSKPSCFEEEDFLIFVYVFLRLEPRTPGQKPSWTLDPSFEQTSQETTKQCYISNFKHLGESGSEEEYF